MKHDRVIPDTKWHHAAVVLDGDNGQMRFYVDGELKTTVDYTGGVNTTTGIPCSSAWKDG